MNELSSHWIMWYWCAFIAHATLQSIGARLVCVHPCGKCGFCWIEVAFRPRVSAGAHDCHRFFGTGSSMSMGAQPLAMGDDDRFALSTVRSPFPLRSSRALLLCINQAVLMSARRVSTPFRAPTHSSALNSRDSHGSGDSSSGGGSSMYQQQLQEHQQAQQQHKYAQQHL